MSVLTWATNGALSARQAQAIALIIFGGAGFSFSVGLTYPVVALLQKHQGFGETEIGVTGAMVGVGLIASAFLIPSMARYLGYRKSILVTGVGGAAVLLAMITAETFHAWAIERFFMAVLAAGLFIGTEAWMNELLPDSIRGRVVGVYAALLSGTFAAGSALLPIIGFLPPLPFLVAAVALAGSAMLVLPLASIDVKPDKEDKAPLLPIIASAPTIFLAIVSLGFFEAAGFNLFPIYIVDAGYSEELAAKMFVALAIGSMIMQPIIGYAADKSTPRKILFLSASASLAISLIFPYLALDGVLAIGLIALIGGTSFGLYTLALTELGRRFSGGALTTAMAITAIAWGAGAMIGPAIAGPLMERFGDVWLFHVLAAMYAGLLLVATLRSKANNAQ